MSKLKQNGSTVFLKVPKEIHFQLKQLAAVNGKPVYKLVLEMINESLARRERGTKPPDQKPYSNNWISENGGIF